MIVRTFFRTREDNVDLYLTYSDDGKKIRQVETDAVYNSAIDVDGASYTYVETDEPRESDLPQPIYNYEEVGRIMMGVEE